jgi:hypothetical protein
MLRTIAGTHLLSAILAILFSAYGSSHAQADNYTFAFTGVVTSVDSPLNSQFAVGNTVQATYTFTDADVDTFPPSDTGTYQNPFITGSVAFSNGYTTSYNPAYISTLIKVENKVVDSYQAYIPATGPIVSGAMPLDFTVLLDDLGGVMLSSDALPTSPPNIALAETRRGYLRFIQGSTESVVNYDIRTLILVPEPSTLLLLAVSAISLLGYRKATSDGRHR